MPVKEQVKPTPGPWKLDGEVDVVDGKGELLASAYGFFDGERTRANLEITEESVANARLIAAAPELLLQLKALAELIPMYIAPGIKAVDGALAETLQVIAKAEGRQ